MSLHSLLVSAKEMAEKSDERYLLIVFLFPFVGCIIFSYTAFINFTVICLGMVLYLYLYYLEFVELLNVFHNSSLSLVLFYQVPFLYL